MFEHAQIVKIVGIRLSCVKADFAYEQMGHQAVAYLHSLYQGDYEYFYSPLNGMLVHHRAPPSTHLYNWVERGNLSVRCLSQEHNTQCPRPGLEAGSSDQRTNHEATAITRNIFTVKRT